MTPVPDKTCPKCDSPNYRFRGRRPVEGKDGPGVETKYACAACGHSWKVRVLAVEAGSGRAR